MIGCGRSKGSWEGKYTSRECWEVPQVPVDEKHRPSRYILQTLWKFCFAVIREKKKSVGKNRRNALSADVS